MGPRTAPPVGDPVADERRRCWGLTSAPPERFDRGMRRVFIVTMGFVCGCAGPSGGGGRAFDGAGWESDLAGPPDQRAASPDAGETADLAGPDLVPSVPALTDLAPADVTIAEGAPFQVTVTFAGRYLGKQPVDVLLVSSDPAVVGVQGGAQLVFNAASTTVSCAALKTGEATLSIAMDGVQRMAAVHVVPSVASVAPSPLRLQVGATASLTITLSAPAPMGGATIAVASADGKRVAPAAPTATVPAGSTSVTVDVTAVAQGGPVAVTASWASSMKTAQVLSIDPVAKLALSEVLYDASGTDEGFEWVELWNGGNAPVDLSGYFLGATASSKNLTYTATTPALTGTLMPGECRVVGGPMADPARNALPANFTFLDPLQFNPSLPNGEAVPNSSTATGLFMGSPMNVAGATLVDAVIYGVASRGIADESGGTTRVDVGYVPFPKQTLERVGPSAWRVQPVPTAGACDWLHL